jgi:hypothetical protein
MRPEAHEHGAVYRFIERGFGAMLSFYQRTLDVVLRHQPITLGVFFATLALTVVMVISIPKGFFPIQDIGLINGIAEGAQETSPEEMMRLQRELGAIILRDPGVAGFGSTTGSPNGAYTANTGNSTIVIKPRDARTLPSQIIDRRGCGSKSPGDPVPPGGAGHTWAGQPRSAFRFTLRDPCCRADRMVVPWTRWTLPELVGVSATFWPARRSSGSPSIAMGVRFGISRS